MGSKWNVIFENCLHNIHWLKYFFQEVLMQGLKKRPTTTAVCKMWCYFCWKGDTSSGPCTRTLKNPPRGRTHTLNHSHPSCKVVVGAGCRERSSFPFIVVFFFGSKIVQHLWFMLLIEKDSRKWNSSHKKMKMLSEIFSLGVWIRSPYSQS